MNTHIDWHENRNSAKVTHSAGWHNTNNDANFQIVDSNELHNGQNYIVKRGGDHFIKCQRSLWLLRCSVSPIIISYFIVELLFELRVLSKVLICRHSAYLLLHKCNKLMRPSWRSSTVQDFKRYFLHNFRLIHIIIITFISRTSAISFSNLSDSISDCFSASFSSTNCTSKKL